MATSRKIGQSGQSGQEFVNQDNAWSAFPMNTYGVPILQAMLDPAQADTTVATFYINEGTAIGGIGLCFDSSPALTLAGDNFYGAAGSECFVRPSAPGLPTWDDWTAWPITTAGANLVAAYSGASAPDKAAIQAINWFQTEYDAAGYGVNGWADNNPEIWEKAARRLVTAVRAAVGKSAAALPVLFATPFPFSPATNSGTEAVYAAQQRLVDDAAFNAARWGGNLMDMVWDRNDGSGGNDGVLRFHPNQGDQTLVSRRAGYAQARILGPAWAPGVYRPAAGRGPRPVYAQWVDGTTIDVFVEHDCGNDLALPASPAAGWRVTYGNLAVTVSSVAKQDGRRLRLTLASSCPIAAAIRVFYSWGAARIIPTPAATGTQGTGAVYDNASTWDAKAIPAGLTGADRLNFPLHRTPVGGLIPNAAAPSSRLVMPL